MLNNPVADFLLFAVVVLTAGFLWAAFRYFLSQWVMS